MCRCCQSCLEDLYWNCFEEKFCFDKTIAEYNPDEDDFVTKNNIILTNSQNNNNQSPIRSQPLSRIESSIFSHAKIHEEDVRREIQTSVPILAPEILAVFNNSQIFQESQSKKLSRVNTKNAIIPAHSPSTTRKEKEMANEQKKLIFQLEGNNQVFQSTNKKLNASNNTVQTSTLSITSKNDGTVTETLNTITIGKNVQFTISDNTPIDIARKSQNPTYSVIAEKDEDEIDDCKREQLKFNNEYLKDSQNSVYQSNVLNSSSKKSSNESFEMGSEEIFLRPSFDVGDDISYGVMKINLLEHKTLRNVLSMPHIRTSTVRNVASETDIFSISGSNLYGQLSMTPEVPSISYAHLPKNYEDTPTIEKYKETMSLYKLQTANKEKANSQVVDYSMPRYFTKTLAHSSHNLENCIVANQNKNGFNKINHHVRKTEKSKRLKLMRNSLPPLVIYRHHNNKDDNQQIQ